MITQGLAVVIEYERDGEIHKTVHTYDNPALFEALVQEGFVESIKSLYVSAGATVHRISKIEKMAVDLDLRKAA